MSSHDSADSMRMGPEQQMPDLVGHHASENSSKVNVVARMERPHSFPEHVAISASSVGAEEGHAEGRVAGGAFDMSDDAQNKMFWPPGPITQRQMIVFPRGQLTQFKSKPARAKISVPRCSARARISSETRDRYRQKQ